VEKCGGVVVRHLKMQLAASSESTSKEMKTKKMKILTDNISELKNFKGVNVVNKLDMLHRSVQMILISKQLRTYLI